MSGYHAKLSPSGAQQYTVCSAAPSEQEGRPDRSGAVTRAGTAGHQIFYEVMTTFASAYDYVDRVLHFGYHPGSDTHFEAWDQSCALTDDIDWIDEVEITEAMAEQVDEAVEYVRELHLRIGGNIYFETDVPIGHLTGEENATGRADVIIISGSIVYIIDLKLGYIKVNAATRLANGAVALNLQLAKYALGAMAKHPAKYTHAVLMVLQPSRHHISEHTATVDDLSAVADFIRRAADETRTNPTYRPEFISCHYCRASGDCDAQYARVMELTSMELPLGERYQQIDFVRDWANATEERTLEALMRGDEVVRVDGMAYKAVEGRGGHRYFTEPGTVEEELSFYLEEEKLYKPRKMQSVAQIEKIAKRAAPDVWKGLTQYIAKPPGKPTVVLSDDPRRSVVNSANGFEDEYDLFGA